MVFVVIVIVVLVFIIINKQNNVNNHSDTSKSYNYKPIYPTKEENNIMTVPFDDAEYVKKTNKSIDKYKTVDDMIFAAMPDGLKEDEQKFFRKWFKKFRFNSVDATEGYLQYVNNSSINNPQKYRDHLYGYNNHRKTEYWIKNKK